MGLPVTDPSLVPPDVNLQRSARDPGQMRCALEAWFDRRHPGTRITSFTMPEANGMSSDTLLLDVTWPREGGSAPAATALVARVAPEADVVPIFPTYDLPGQARVMTEARRAAPTVPIPEVYWDEPDPAVLGTPFFVMERVDGRVPPDVMPYTFDSWLTAATDQERRHLQDRTVQVLVDLHAIPEATDRFAFLAAEGSGATALQRHLAAQGEFYEWAHEGLRVPLIERTFRWLSDHLPRHESPVGFCWGDARIGNVIYDGFTPAAVLDWEMATLAPPEFDLTWMAYMHTFFQDIAEVFEMPGLPGFCGLDDCASTYEKQSGRTPRDLHWYTVYAALRYAVVSIRALRRRAHFGEAVMPDDPDDLILHRAGLERLLSSPGPLG